MCDKHNKIFIYIYICLFALGKHAVCEWMQKGWFECYFLLRAPASGWVLELPTDRPATALDASSIVPSMFINGRKKVGTELYVQIIQEKQHKNFAIRKGSKFKPKYKMYMEPTFSLHFKRR